MPARVQKDIKAFKKSLTAGNGIVQAKRDAGYSENTARIGLHQLPKRFLKLVEKQRNKFETLSLSHTPEQQEHAIRGRLLANLYAGEDVAVGSAKLLGQDKRVNMFTADSQIGVIVIQSSAESMEKPILDLKQIEE